MIPKKIKHLNCYLFYRNSNKLWNFGIFDKKKTNYTNSKKQNHTIYYKNKNNDHLWLTKSSLNICIFKSTGHRPFQCTVSTCLKTFSQKCALNLHILSHTAGIVVKKIQILTKTTKTKHSYQHQYQINLENKSK